MTAWRDLETRGYLHVPGFLDPAEIEALVDAYSSGVDRCDVSYANRRYPLERMIDLAALEPIQPRLQAALASIRASTRFEVDTVVKAIYFATRKGSYSWHQDLDFWARDRFNLLNFFLPLVKPFPERSNLSVIGFDALSEVPGLAERFLGGAGRDVRVKRGKTRVVDVEAGASFVLDLDIESFATTPRLEPGDLLLLRGDVLHRTHDPEPERLALSLRLASSSSVIRREHVVTGSVYKQRVIESMRDEYDELLRCFEADGRDELSVGRWIELRRPSG